ncbi:tetratricopeptide repeat protein [Pseudomonadota bacterium]
MASPDPLVEARARTAIRYFFTNFSSIDPSPGTLELLLERGFETRGKNQSVNAQLWRIVEILPNFNVQNPDTVPELEAAIFLLGYRYNEIMRVPQNKDTNLRSQVDVFNWPFWLGKAEYNLGVLTEDKTNQRKIFTKAKKHLSRAITSGNEDRELLAFMGYVLFEEKSHHEAEQFLRRAKKARFRDSKMYRTLGMSIFHQSTPEEDRHREALSFFKEAKRKGDISEELFEYLGKSYHYLEDWANSVKFLRMAHDRGAENKTVTGILANDLYNLGEVQEALEFALKSEQDGNNTIEHYDLVSLLYYRARDFEKAIEYSKRAVNIKPNRGRFRRIGMSYSWLRNYEEAKKYLDKAKARGGLQEKDELMAMGVCLVAEGDYIDALTQFQAAWEATVDDGYDDIWMHAMDHLFERAFERIEIPKDEQGLVEVIAFLEELDLDYSIFYDDWAEKKKDQVRSKLYPIDTDSVQINRITILRNEAERELRQYG